MYKRSLNLDRLLHKKSHFLFGPRGTGKSFLVRHQLDSLATTIDLLNFDVYSRLLRQPSLLESLIRPDRKWVVVDEVQKIPALLDEVHRLIELKSLRFLLTGSSARKLKRGAANLLGGRAWEARLFPLTSDEIGEDMDLERYLNQGGLPAVYASEHAAEELRNYARLYLQEEIQSEGLVRRVDHFARFLDVAALANSEELSFEAIASDSGVPARTVASYFEILEDTLLGFQVPPFQSTHKRKAIKRSKFYFFDVGVAGALARRGRVSVGSELFGKAFEHFIMQELRAYLSYRGLDHPLCYWRSTSQFEVDAVIGKELAIEIKATERVSGRHLTGLKALAEENQVKQLIAVSRDPIERFEDGIRIVPWRAFLARLWADEWLR